MKLKPTLNTDKDFLLMVQKLDEYLALTDGAEHAYYNQYNGTTQLDHVIVAYDHSGPVGCGAYKRVENNIAEVKRMYTSPQARGKGVASQILHALESHAAIMGFDKVQLETGLRQTEAVAFYKKQQYEIIPNYGQYQDMANSLCFEKQLASPLFKVRTIAPTDNAILAKIIRSIFIEHEAPKEGTVYSDPTTDDLYSLFSTERSVLYVGLVNGNVVGCGGIYPTEGLPTDCAEFVKFYIAPVGRGLGLGRFMMSECDIAAKRLQYKSLYLESLPVYAKAVTMYRTHGYNSLTEALGNSSHGACNVWMQKQL